MINPSLIARLSLRHIRCFTAIARERNLGRAALSLGLTQPAVSKTLSELEATVGVKLIERGRLGAHLTGDGHLFLTHALAVLDAVEAAVEAVHSGPQRSHQHIRVGALPTVAPALLPAAIERFRPHYPDARVTVEVSANIPLLDSLRAGGLDFIIGRMSDPQSMVGLSFDLLFVEPLFLAVRADHPLSGSHIPNLSDVMSYPLVVSTPGTVPRHRTENFLAAHGVRLTDGYVETLSISVARQLVLKTPSIWFVPQGAVSDDVARGDMVTLAVDCSGTEEPVGFVRRSQQTVPPAAQTLMDIIRGLTSER